MIINANIPALRVHHSVSNVSRRSNASMERLSTGLRINSASDDPSGLAKANKMRREINGIGAVSQNTLDATSIIQTADSALDEVHSMLHRMRELTVQAANDTMSEEDIAHIQAEIDELNQEIESVGRNTNFNNRPIFQGSFTDSNLEDHTHGRIMARVGTNKDNTLYMTFPRISTQELGTEGTSIGSISLADDEAGMLNAFAAIDEAIHQISSARANLGAYENRLAHTSSVLSATGVNMESALSRMIDVDMALEMSMLTQHGVLSQAGLSVLAQANQRPQQILQFLN